MKKFPDPPGTPSVAGYDSNKPWKAGELQKLVCTSSGGNPQATLKWYKNDKEVIYTTSFKQKIII